MKKLLSNKKGGKMKGCKCGGVMYKKGGVTKHQQGNVIKNTSMASNVFKNKLGYTPTANPAILQKDGAEYRITPENGMFAAKRTTFTPPVDNNSPETAIQTFQTKLGYTSTGQKSPQGHSMLQKDGISYQMELDPTTNMWKAVQVGKAMVMPKSVIPMTPLKKKGGILLKYEQGGEPKKTTTVNKDQVKLDEMVSHLNKNRATPLSAQEIEVLKKKMLKTK